MTTDLYRAASGDCRPQVVERTRLRDLLDEMLLQQQPYFDAACRGDAPLSYVGAFGGSATYEGGSITETWNATDVVYELEFTGDYRLRSGAFTWSISGSTDDSFSGHCTYSGSGSFDLSYARGTLSAREGFYSVYAGGGPPEGSPVLVECTEREPETQSWGGYGYGPTGRWLNSGGTLSNQGMLRPFEDGHLIGSLSGEGEGAAVAWHWDFRAK